MVPGKGIRLPDGNKMERMTILTPPADYDPLRAMTGIMVQDRPRGWNMCGYSNHEFDRISENSSRAMDIGQRKKFVFQMQQILAEDLPYLPLYNPKLVEAVNSDRFSGWVEMLGGIGNIWSFCQIKPTRSKNQ
jgi:ABC-type transport system substrate-binding protein